MTCPECGFRACPECRLCCYNSKCDSYCDEHDEGCGIGAAEERLLVLLEEDKERGQAVDLPSW